MQNHFPLLEEAYFQQEKLNNHYDYGRPGLKALVSIDPSFLLRYVQHHFHETSWETKDMDDTMAFIWDLEISDEILVNSFSRIIDYTVSFGDHTLNIFFQNLDDQGKTKALSFLERYFHANINDDSKVDIIVNILIHSLPDEFNRFILLYLKLLPDPEEFKKIQWIKTGGVYSGDVNISALRAEQWQKILDQVTNAPNQLQLLPIKQFIKSQIQDELKNAEIEKQRKFSNPKW